jgi:hypothetical protein
VSKQMPTKGLQLWPLKMCSCRVPKGPYGSSTPSKSKSFLRREEKESEESERAFQESKKNTEYCFSESGQNSVRKFLGV